LAAAQTLREYLAAVRELALKRHGRIEEGSELHQWLVWAGQQADRCDPLSPKPPSVLDDEVLG
jgi:hypothetical protein